MGSMDLIFTPTLVRHVLGLLATLNSPFGRHNPPPTAHSHQPHPIIHVFHDITVVMKEVAQDPAVLSSYWRWI